MFNKKFVLIVLVALSLAVSGCKTGLLGGAEPAPPPSQPAPAAPVSTDGVRTSYADVVEKTSPAVVRIEADHHSKSQPMQFPFGNNDFFRQTPAPRPNQRGPIERGLGSGVLVSAAGWNTANWVALPVLAAAALAVMLLGWHRRESSSSMRYLATVQRAPSRITRLFSRNIDACARCALRLRRPTNARDTRQSHAIAAARA